MATRVSAPAATSMAIEITDPAMPAKGPHFRSATEPPPPGWLLMRLRPREPFARVGGR